MVCVSDIIKEKVRPKKITRLLLFRYVPKEK